MSFQVNVFVFLCFDLMIIVEATNSSSWLVEKSFQSKIISCLKNDVKPDVSKCQAELYSMLNQPFDTQWGSSSKFSLNFLYRFLVLTPF